MLKRRTMLSALVAAALSAGSNVLRAGEPATTTSRGRRLPWRNWSGSQNCLPQARVAPASVSELQALIAQGSGVIRAVGAGHSFSPLVPTDGTFVSLSPCNPMTGYFCAPRKASLFSCSLATSPCMKRVLLSSIGQCFARPPQRRQLPELRQFVLC